MGRETPVDVEKDDISRVAGQKAKIIEKVMPPSENMAVFLNKNTHLPIEVRAALTASIFQALADFGSKGLVHNDLKPENVMIAIDKNGRPTGKAEIIGLDLAQHGKPGEMVPYKYLEGAMGYIAPERLKRILSPMGEAPLETVQKADIYALGPMMIWMLGGVPPYDAALNAAFRPGNKIFAKAEARKGAPLSENEILQIIQNDYLIDRGAFCRQYLGAQSELVYVAREVTEVMQAVADSYRAYTGRDIPFSERLPIVEHILNLYAAVTTADSENRISSDVAVKIMREISQEIQDLFIPAKREVLGAFTGPALPALYPAEPRSIMQGMRNELYGIFREGSPFYNSEKFISHLDQFLESNSEEIKPQEPEGVDNFLKKMELDPANPQYEHFAEKVREECAKIFRVAPSELLPPAPAEVIPLPSAEIKTMSFEEWKNDGFQPTITGQDLLNSIGNEYKFRKDSSKKGAVHNYTITVKGQDRKITKIEGFHLPYAIERMTNEKTGKEEVFIIYDHTTNKAGSSGVVRLLLRITDDLGSPVILDEPTLQTKIDEAMARNQVFMQKSFKAKFEKGEIPPDLFTIQKEATINDRFYPTGFGPIINAVAKEKIADQKEYLKVKIIGKAVLGEDMQAFIDRNQALSIEQRFALSSNLFRELAYIHSQGGVHNDIKPENILVILDKNKQPTGEIKIIDFGMYQEGKPGEKIEIFHCGTPAYAGIEKYITKGGIKIEDLQKTDMWAMALVMLQALNVIPPFNAACARYPQLFKSKSDLERTLEYYRFQPNDFCQRYLGKTERGYLSDQLGKVLEFYAQDYEKRTWRHIAPEEIQKIKDQILDLYFDAKKPDLVQRMSSYTAAERVNKISEKIKDLFAPAPVGQKTSAVPIKAGSSKIMAALMRHLAPKGELTNQNVKDLKEALDTIKVTTEEKDRIIILLQQRGIGEAEIQHIQHHLQEVIKTQKEDSLVNKIRGILKGSAIATTPTLLLSLLVGAGPIGVVAAVTAGGVVGGIVAKGQDSGTEITRRIRKELFDIYDESLPIIKQRDYDPKKSSLADLSQFVQKNLTAIEREVNKGQSVLDFLTDMIGPIINPKFIEAFDKEYKAALASKASKQKEVGPPLEQTPEPSSPDAPK